MFTCYQELRLQERNNGLDPGSLPGSLTVILQDELADSVQPGGARRAAGRRAQGAGRRALGSAFAAARVCLSPADACLPPPLPRRRRGRHGRGHRALAAHVPGRALRRRAVPAGQQHAGGDAEAQVFGGGVGAAGGHVGGWGWAGLGWAGLGWAGLGWAGLGWAGLGWAGLGWAGLGWAGLGWAGLAGACGAASRSCMLKCATTVLPVPACAEAAGPPARRFNDFWASHSNCPLVARNKILAGICPQVGGAAKCCSALPGSAWAACPARPAASIARGHPDGCHGARAPRRSVATSSQSWPPRWRSSAA
jgi:hypothetical protein